MLDDKEMRKLSCNLISEPMDYMHSFRENIRMYIDRKEITLAEISELADLPESTLKTFVYGKSADCHLSTAIKLAKVFRVSIDELVGAGTISPQTCESLQTVRLLPESFTHFVRWSIHFHYDMLMKQKVTIRSVEIMKAKIGDNGNLKMTNNMDIMDISDLNDDIRPSIFMGIRIPSDLYAPNFFENDVLFIANDREPRETDMVVVCFADNMYIFNEKKEIIDGKKKKVYYSIRDGRKRATEDEINLVIGYIVHVKHS